MVEDSIEIAAELIKSFEGLSLVKYKCSGGMTTIGYGHVIRKNEEITDCITKEQAEMLLAEDIKIAQYALHRYCHVPLSATQEAALISFIFNLGAGAFQASVLRQKLNRHEYILAANELIKWVYARGIRLKGLEARRTAERNLFLADIDNISNVKESNQGSPQYSPRQIEQQDNKPVDTTAISATSVIVPIIWVVTNVRSSFRKLKARIV